MAKLRLALIAGGVSAEREVSLRGAAGVEQALNRDRYDVVRYDPATDLARIAADAVFSDLLACIHGGICQRVSVGETHLNGQVAHPEWLF